MVQHRGKHGDLRTTAIAAVALLAAMAGMVVSYRSYSEKMVNLDELAPWLFGCWSLLGVLALAFRRPSFVAILLLAQALLTVVVFTGDHLPDGDTVVGVSCVGMIVGILTGAVHTICKLGMPPTVENKGNQRSTT